MADETPTGGNGFQTPVLPQQAPSPVAMAPAETLRHLRVLIDAAMKVDDLDTMRALLIEMRRIVDRGK